MKLPFLFLFLSALCLGQRQDYPKDYFRSPLDIPLFASGSFGELRGNHFHSGLDFKTLQRQGLPVFAVADGFVSRIKISEGGYGKALYVTHPNGYTSVYGHLKQFTGAIAEFVRKRQYAEKSYEIELFPMANELRVEKGQQVAFSGNTGSSGGPHLHFEIRDSKTEQTINPLFFGFDAKMPDKKAPMINDLVAYAVGDSSVVNQSQRTIPVSLSLQPDGSYLASKVLGKGTIGFAVNTYDTADNNYNWNGIYKAAAFLNGSQIFSYEFDKFSFDQTRYINNFIDYYRYKTINQTVQKLFFKRRYPFSMIDQNKKNGLISVLPNSTFNYRIEISDFHGNKRMINVPIQFSEADATIAKEEKITPYYVKSRNDNNYTKDNVSVFIPENAFYEDFYMNFEVKDNVLYLHNETVPVHNNITVTFDVSAISGINRDKTFISRMDGTKKEYFTTYKKGNLFSARTKDLGKFFLATDTIAPRIYRPNFKEGENLDGSDTLTVHIDDDLSGIKQYNGYLNGKWILMDYDYKTKTLTHYFDDAIYEEGKNELKVVVSDKMGNSTIFETHFLKTKNTQPVEKNN
ncbi:peptidoglycan DD-metalloendopeptidase family protein [Flavobacterium sp. SM15]|uniref:peptidoglycan DD-metalloendopeptidase family protein n=1 Tax=Flavobacterium sp. SM15 TaxID=2908005 RepID=UPI001EDB1B32|nr:peptidoglycan DD-metalloendopeptidase family protein [Flavobacterium sp. SM15]MCG2610521.1 peptidoglycan DD-metalloendopeptidase family protein [Flavobacterium sp. SM15]